ncbi:MAG: 4Fe-4S binding protein [Sedimentisphaerales bacterium]|nr:4Fe-4S binding protein [Sedimentisphaerales bacterium]
MNLLKIKYIGGLFRASWFPLVPQMVMLIVFILLVAGGLGVTASDPDLIYRLRYTNLANLIVWSYWWPLIIIAAIFLGRLWCTVCPVELITYYAGKIGLKRQAPHILKSGWIVTIFYTLIWIVGVHTLAVNRVPHQMALYMLMLIILAIDISLIFQNRAFCSYICPVGHLLGLYALMSPFEWRADDQSICSNCKTKDCVVKKNHYRLISRSCTSNLYPAAIKDNRDCLLCTQCLKACPYKNIRFSARRPFADFFTGIDLRPAEVGFILLVSSFVVFEILSEWIVSLDILMWAPDHFTSALGITGSMANFVSAIIMFIVFPALALLVLIVLAQLVSDEKGAPLGAAIRTFALLLLPTVAGAHIIKSILKMSSQIPFWRHALSDTNGIETAQRIAAGTLELNKSASDALYPAISLIAAAILLIALAATMQIFCKSVVVQKHTGGVKFVLLLGVLAYWSIFGLTIFNWRFG